MTLVLLLARLVGSATADNNLRYGAMGYYIVSYVRIPEAIGRERVIPPTLIFLLESGILEKKGNPSKDGNRRRYTILPTHK